MIYIKTQREIDIMREPNRIVAETLNEVKKNVRPGVSTKELDLIAEDFIRSNGGRPAFKGYVAGDTIPFPGSICSSIDDVVVHGIPENRKLKEGEIISVDVGVEKNHYYGDSAITIAVGEISAEKRRLMEVTEKALYLGIEQAVEGNRVHDISAAIQQYVEENGFSVVRALCGHGIGKNLHEEPSVPNYGKQGTGKKLKSGMTIAIEPMVNAGVFDVVIGADGWTVYTADSKPSAHFEHSIAITKTKPIILTQR